VVRFWCYSSGSVAVGISNETAGYAMQYRLGKWASENAPVIPGRKKKAKLEGR
jgi:hypothetical protein